MSNYGGADATTPDMLSQFRSSSFSYGGGRSSCYNSWSGSSPYPDEGVEYATYSSYPVLGQESMPLVPGYARYGSGKPVYVETDVPSYSNYSGLVHRPAPQDTTSPFTLSSMTASLPSSSERLMTADRALLQGSSGSGASCSRSLAGYSSRTGTDSSQPAAVAESYAAADFESPISYATATTTLPSSDTTESLYALDSYGYGATTRDQSRRESLASVYPSDPHQTSSLATPYSLPLSSTASSVVAGAHGSCGESAAASSGRSSGNHHGSSASTAGSHSQLHSGYDTRAISSLRGSV